MIILYIVFIQSINYHSIELIFFDREEGCQLS